MPLHRTKANVQTSRNVETNKDVESLKISSTSNFATGGLNDETVKATTNPLTIEETKQVQINTTNVSNNVKSEYMKQITSHVETYNLQPPEKEEYMDPVVADLCIAKIWQAIVTHKWYPFFTKVESGVRIADKQKLQNYANISTRHAYNLLVELYGYGNLDVATNLAVKSLVDTILLCDNSGSMQLTDRSERGDIELSRWDALKLVAKDDAFVASMFDSDGFQLDFMTGDMDNYGRDNGKLRSICTKQNVNGVLTWVLPDPKTEGKYAVLLEERGIPYGFKGLTSQEQVELIFGTGLGPDYTTPTAEAIRRIYETQVRDKARKGILEKPVIVTCYTDGKPSGANVKNEIRKIKAQLASTIYGGHAMLFQIVQCGKENAVNEWFDELDKDEEIDKITGKPIDPNPGVGDIIDCVSDYEIELKQVLEKNPGCDWFDVPYYRVKCRVGCAIRALDQADEQTVSKPVTGLGTIFSKMGF